MADIEANRKQILEYPDAFEGLVKLMDIGKSIGFLHHVVNTVVMLAVEVEGGPEIGDISGVMFKLVTIVREDCGRVVVQEAAGALLKLAKIEANRKQIPEYGRALKRSL